MIRRFLVALLFVGVPASAADVDLILHNGKIVTVDPSFHVVEAVAIKGGRITAAGTSDSIPHAERTPRTRAVDLAGKTVLPGLIDAHVRALEAGLSAYHTRLPRLHSGLHLRCGSDPSQRQVGPRASHPASASQGNAIPDQTGPRRGQGPPGRLRRQLRLGSELASAQTQRHRQRHAESSQRRNCERARREPNGIGLESVRCFFPLRSYIDRGIIVAGDSDHMIGYDKNAAVNNYNPFFNMWACITRRTREGEVIYPQEKITRQEVRKMWTIWAAYLQFGEKSRSSIEPGKFADLVVIDRDYLTCPKEDIRRIEPVAAIVNGRVVAGKL